MTIRRNILLFLKAVVACLVFLALARLARAQDNFQITVPSYKDRYSKFVQQLEAGGTKVDYRAFRDSFLESEQFKVASNQKSDLDSLRKTLHGLMEASKYPDILKVTKKILSVDYTDLEAHKILQQTYKILGDMANQRKYHDIEFGLLNSIVQNGDGKTCQTAWPVIQIKEEYFILNTLGAKVSRQSVDRTGGVCDKMDVQTDEGPKTYYFNVAKVFEGYKKLGLE